MSSRRLLAAIGVAYVVLVACEVNAPRVDLCARLPTTPAGSAMAAVSTIAARRDDLGGCHIRTAGFLSVDEGVRLFFTRYDYDRYNSFNSVVLDAEYSSEADRRLAPPLAAFSSRNNGDLVIVDGVVAAQTGDDCHLRDLTLIAPYGKPE